MGTKNSTGFIKDEHLVYGGKAKVLRTSQSGDIYQFRMWIPQEGKFDRKSLKTRDLDTAMERAENRFLDLTHKIKSGQKLFGTTLEELVNSYLEWRAEDIQTENITAGRHVTIRSQLKHFLKYKGNKTKISELDTESCYDYADWCRMTRKDVRDVTIRNEQSTINHMFKFAYRKGYCSFPSLVFRKLRVRKDEDSRRNTFTQEQYDDLTRYMRSWASKKACGQDIKLLQQRTMIRYCILIASNTMLRVGELWSLRWSDIEKIEFNIDSLGRKTELVTISVRAETSKNRVARRIVTRGGEYFRRFKEIAQPSDLNQLVFCDESGYQPLSKVIIYNAWKELMYGIGINHKEEKIYWYSLRHFAITCRLRAGVPIYHIGKVAGTSTTFIDTNYGHFDEKMSTDAALKNFVYTRERSIE